MPDSTTKINFATTYQHPIHALLQGQPVRLLATGDVQGMSPSFQYCDQSGNIDWAPASNFTIVDSEALPLGTDMATLYEQGSRKSVSGSVGSSSSPVGATSSR